MQVSVGGPESLMPELRGLSHYWLALTGESTGFYRQMANRGDIVVLDYPIHEAGGSVVTTPQEAIQAIQAIQATHFVIPDIEHRGKESLDLAREFSPVLRQQMPDVKLVGVPHGEDIVGWCYNAAQFAQSGLIDVIAIPNATTRAFTKRKVLADYVARNYPTLKMILLGAEPNTDDLFQLAGYKNIIGVDTTRPVTLALQGVDWEVWEQKPALRRLTLMRRENLLGEESFNKLVLTQAQTMLAVQNANYLKRVAGGKA